VAQFIVVVQVFIAERQRQDPLADQRLHLMLDQSRMATIHEAAGKAADQSDRPVRQTQQQPAGIRSDRPTVKAGHNSELFYSSKIKPFRATLCLHRGTPLLRLSLCSRSIFPDSEPRCTSTL
jgi:hypothetical protein